MGSVGFSEIAVIAVLALFVLGPDRLPQAARSIGRALSEFRRLTSGARADLEQALDATGMRDTLAEIRGTVDELNPRRIVTDSLRAVDSSGTSAQASYGTVTGAVVDDGVEQGSTSHGGGHGGGAHGAASIPPPDADVADVAGASPSARPGGLSSVAAPVLPTGFHDVLVDPDPTETVP